MNENLLFRIWDKTNKVYVTSHRLNLVSKDNDCLCVSCSSRYVIDQFTGKYDTMGTRIFVGDVLAEVNSSNSDPKTGRQMRLHNRVLKSELLVNVAPAADGTITATYRTGRYSTPLPTWGILWLCGECFGYEGERLTDSCYWLVVGHVRDPKWDFVVKHDYSVHTEEDDTGYTHWSTYAEKYAEIKEEEELHEQTGLFEVMED